MEVVSDLSQKKREKTKTKPKRYYDYTLLIIVLTLVGFGLMMVASASSYYAISRGLPANTFLKSQAIKAVIGIAGMIFISKFNYNILKSSIFKGKISIANLFFGFCFALQIAVLIVGRSANGSSRWLEIPIIGSFQPSELSKLCLIILVAKAISEKAKRLERFMGFLAIIIVAGPLIAVVAMENLSTAIIMAGITFIICFVASSKWLYFLVTILMLIPAGVIAIMTQPYRLQRIKVWLEDGSGYQISQGLYAISSGGWLGVGLGNSSQKRWVPEVHTDMIFTIICEELGVVGVLILFLIYILLILRIAKIAINAADLFGSLICVGVLCHVALQVVLNVAVTTSIMPATGVILPFISFGGTSLIVLLAEMGLVLSVSNRIEYEQ